MGSFSAEWLLLREPADHAARSIALTRAALASSAGNRRSGVLDLAAGTGSNQRYLEAAAAEAGAALDFLLVDHDPSLLARVPPAANIVTRCLDLSALDDRTLFEGRSIVTASALLDLVSERWLCALADRCAEVSATVLFALTYDGRIVFSPEDNDDHAIIALINEHQRTEKGFGVALGPGASDCADRCLGDRGYRVVRDRTDWVLTAATADLQRQLIDGWADAAAELVPLDAAAIDAWRRRRHSHVDAGSSRIVVGHEDVLGILGIEDVRI
jgi:hypothetical protein